MYQMVRSAFIVQGTSLNRWCFEQGIKRQNVRKALLGEWNGPKAEDLRTFVLSSCYSNETFASLNSDFLKSPETTDAQNSGEGKSGIFHDNGSKNRVGVNIAINKYSDSIKQKKSNFRGDNREDTCT